MQRNIMLLTGIGVLAGFLLVLGLEFGLAAALCGALVFLSTLIICVTLEVGHEFDRPERAPRNRALVR